jgi:hypothetical protein
MQYHLADATLPGNRTRYGFVPGQTTDSCSGRLRIQASATKARRQESPPVIAHIRADERPAIKRPPRAWRASGPARAPDLRSSPEIGLRRGHVADARRCPPSRRHTPWPAEERAELSWQELAATKPHLQPLRSDHSPETRGYALRSIEVSPLGQTGRDPTPKENQSRPHPRTSACRPASRASLSGRDAALSRLDGQPLATS